MNGTALFVKNVETLMKSRGFERPFAFWNKVNELAGKRVITPSYWSKIKGSLKEGGTPHNISLGVVEETARTMGLEAWQLLQPGFLSVSDQVITGNTVSEVEKSILFAEKVVNESSELPNLDLIGEIAITHYTRRNDTGESLAIAVLDILNKFNKSQTTV